MFKGRSKHAIQIDLKTAEKGYKLYAAADKDYLFDFLYSFKIAGVVELRLFIPSSPLYQLSKNQTFLKFESVVLTLIDRIRQTYPSLLFLVIIDNFFTTYKLYSKLREWGIKVYKTCKQRTFILKEFTILRLCISKERD
jgi:hypothetical protein